MNKWIVNAPDRELTEKLKKDTGLPDFICRVLVSRGIASRESADRFFNGTVLSDPMMIKDMDKAVVVVSEAIENGDKIAIYGDYDCDGITSTYMLHNYLEACAADVTWYIPDRDEGYGLNNAAIDLLKKQGAKLIITVDNGISAVDEAKHIKELGMKLVITDHHHVPDVIPDAEAVVDPHRPDDLSEYKDLAGCGVALKLIMALENASGGDPESVFTQYADIAAVGTVADIVNLDGENRIIVREGMRLMENTENMGLNRLLLMSSYEPGTEITSSLIGFRIAPKINAAGRLASPKLAMDMLMSPTMNTAAANSQALCELNDDRKKLEDEIIAQTDEQIRNDPDLLNRRLLIVCGDGWKHGVIGLASGELLKKYGKPNIVITKEGDTARGSARSTDDLHLYKMLENCSDKLIRFGGHTKAAGLTVSSDMLAEFEKAAYSYCEQNIKEACANTLTADMELMPGDLSVENAQLIENLEPFGEGNREPQFCIRNCVITSKKPIKDGKYTSFGFSFGGSEYRAVHFGSTFDAFPFLEGDTTDIIATLSINEFRGNRTVTAFVKDMRYAGFRQDRYFAARTAYEDYRCGTVDEKLLCRMAPDNAELRTVYDILRQTRSLSKAETLADRSGINCCKFRIILDIFGEFRLAATDVTKDSVTILPAGQKADLTKSRVLAGLHAAAK